MQVIDISMTSTTLLCSALSFRCEWTLVCLSITCLLSTSDHFLFVFMKLHTFLYCLLSPPLLITLSPSIFCSGIPHHWAHVPCYPQHYLAPLLPQQYSIFSITCLSHHSIFCPLVCFDFELCRMWMLLFSLYQCCLSFVHCFVLSCSFWHWVYF